jgi:pyruvate dehydrogenase E2 component (dihydrolipoamide acetyltransferase)
MITPSGSRGEVKARDIESVTEIAATPLARKMAKDWGIDLAEVEGTGFGGKIREADILAVGKRSAKDDAGAVSQREPVRVPMKGMRKRIAERMLQSHLQAPPVTLNVNVDVTELLNIRKRLNESLDSKISVNDFLLKVTAIALREHPAINASIDGDEIVYHPVVNLGMAVAVEEGLITPVIRHADTLSLLQLSKLTKELAEKARGGGLLPDDYMGGTFTVSNLGIYDIVYFTPIINPPESGILGVCAIEDRVRINGEKIEKRKVMGLSLTFDHRVIDGAQSAIFLKKIKSLLENPLELMAQ